jgi:predicted TIM-barrel fold metal-dependent hydrolase
VDFHAHVIDERFPLWAGRGYEPRVATLDDYLGFLDRNGIARGVLVQPSVYGFDNRCLLDGLQRADGRLRGIAVPAPDTTAEELEAMHRSGVRGVRCNLMYPGGLGFDAVSAWQPVLHELGWRVELQIALETVTDLAALIERFEGPIVIDHMGRPTPGQCDPSRPALQQLIALVRAGACYVKLSAPYRLSVEKPPWRDVAPLAQALLAANASKCLWGSDWPHLDTGARVTEPDLFAALTEWCPNGQSSLLITPASTPFSD